MAELRILRDSVTEKDGDVAKAFLLESLSSLGRLQEPLKELKEHKFDFPEIAKYTERLSLLSAALPPEGERRDVQLKACGFLEKLFGLVDAFHCYQLAEDSDQGSSIQKLKACMDDFMKYTNIGMMTVSVLKTLQNKTIEQPFTAEQFGQICSKLSEDVSKAAVALEAVIGTVKDLKLPDTSTLSYAPSDDKQLPKLERDFPSLNEFNDRVPELSGYANKLHAVETNVAVPSKLASELAETLATCKEHTLIIPGELQAQAAQYSSQEKNNKET
eukprot:s434_g21.t1